MSIGGKYPPNLADFLAPRQRQHQEDASFLWIEIVGRYHAGLDKVTAWGNPAAAGAARLHDDDAGVTRLLEGCSLERRGNAWRRNARR